MRHNRASNLIKANSPQLKETMKRNFILTHTTKKGYEIWTNFKKLCDARGWDYDDMRMQQKDQQQRGLKRWPVFHEGYTIRPNLVNEILI